jgi:hypothetical protein
MSQSEPEKKPLSRMDATRFLAFVALQVGCFTFLIVIVALVAGLSLDRIFQVRGLFTILLVLASVPLTWIFIFWSVNRAKKQIEASRPASPQGTITVTEEEDRDNS